MNRLVAVAAKSVAIVVVLMCSGCAVMAVADAVVTATATVIKTGVKVADATIDLCDSGLSTTAALTTNVLGKLLP